MPTRPGHELISTKIGRGVFGLVLLARREKGRPGCIGRRYVMSWHSMAKLAYGAVTNRRALSEGLLLLVVLFVIINMTIYTCNNYIATINIR